MIRCLVLACTLSAIASCFAFAAPAEKPVVVGGDRDFAPFEYLAADGRPAGFDVDILLAVAEVMNLPVELELGPWEEVRQDLEAGRIDALAGMRYSEERDLRLDFSTPYLINSSAIFVRKDSAIRSLADLRGRDVIVQRGDIMEDFLQDNRMTFNLVFVPDQARALELLAAGRHAAALCNRLRGLYLVRERGLENLTTVGPALESGPYGFAVTEGNTALLERIDEGLRILRTTGRYDEIYQRWFGLLEKQSFGERLLRYALWTVTPLLLLGVALTWSWTLRRQVAAKTRELAVQLEQTREARARLDAEQTFRKVVEASPVPMAISDEGRIHFLNRKFSELFGYSLEDLPSIDIWWTLACPDPEHRREVVAAWRSRLADGDASPRQGEPFETAVTCRDGSLRHVVCRLSAIDHRHFMVFNDITERKLAEQALEDRSQVEALVSTLSTRFVNMDSADVDREIDRALQEVGEQIGVDRSYVFRFSADRRTMSNSHEWCAAGIEPQRDRLQGVLTGDFRWFLTQLIENGVLHCPSVAALGPEARSEQREWLREGIRSLVTVPMMLRGSMVGFVGFDSVRKEQGWPGEVLFLLRLVGESFASALERRRAENELRTAHQQLADIIDFLPDATFVIDRDGRVVAWNRAVEELTGRSKQEMLGRGNHAYAIALYGERQATLVDRILAGAAAPAGEGRKLQQNGGAHILEKYLPALYGGRGAYVWVKASPLYDRRGNLAGAIESIRDISDRREAQERLEASNREMEAFVYTVSHDLRSPLTPIIGYADFLRENYRHRLDQQALGCLAEISSAGSKMLQLMEDLLALARVGQIEAAAEPVEAGEVARRALDELSGQVAESGVEIAVGPLPALRLSDTLLYQLFSNLLHNALLYGGDGGKVEIWGERDGETARLFVRDHGPGVPEAERERIFEVFYRGSGGRGVAGTGIGLATVAKIARLCGGRAGVRETPGGGATFWVEVREQQAD